MNALNFFLLSHISFNNFFTWLFFRRLKHNYLILGAFLHSCRLAAVHFLWNCLCWFLRALALDLFIKNQIVFDRLLDSTFMVTFLLLFLWCPFAHLLRRWLRNNILFFCLLIHRLLVWRSYLFLAFLLLTLLFFHKFHIFLQLYLLLFSISKLLSIEFFLSLQIVLDSFLFVEVPALIELCIAEAFIWKLVNQILLVGEKRVIIGDIFLVKFGQSISLDLYLRFNVLKFVDGFRICEEVLSIYVRSDPFLLRKLMDDMRVFRVGKLRRLRVVTMRKRGLYILRLDVGVLGHLALWTINFINCG